MAFKSPRTACCLALLCLVPIAAFPDPSRSCHPHILKHTHPCCASRSQTHPPTTLYYAPTFHSLYFRTLAAPLILNHFALPHSTLQQVPGTRVNIVPPGPPPALEGLENPYAGVTATAAMDTTPHYDAGTNPAAMVGTYTAPAVAQTATHTPVAAFNHAEDEHAAAAAASAGHRVAGVLPAAPPGGGGGGGGGVVDTEMGGVAAEPIQRRTNPARAARPPAPPEYAVASGTRTTARRTSREPRAAAEAHAPT